MEIPEVERKKVLDGYFNKAGTRLIDFPRKLKRKLIILDELIKQFDKKKMYSEQEVNKLLKQFYDDYTLIRRLFVEYNYMGRTKNGYEYWVK